MYFIIDVNYWQATPYLDIVYQTCSLMIAAANWFKIIVDFVVKCNFTYYNFWVLFETVS